MANFMVSTPLTNSSSGTTTKAIPPTGLPGGMLGGGGGKSWGSPTQFNPPAPTQTPNPLGQRASSPTLKPTVVSTAQPAVKDLQTKQAQVATLTTGMQQQSAAKAAAKAAIPPPVAPAKPPSDVDTLNQFLSARNPQGFTAQQMSQAAGQQPTAPSAGTPPAASTPQNAAPSTPAPPTPTDPATQQLNDLNAKSDEAFQTFQNSMTQLQNGTFPLTPTQQAQLDSTQQMYQGLIQEQKSANESYTQGVTEAGISAGRARYAPEIAMGEIQNSISVGVQKIAKIEGQMTDAMSKLQEGFKTDDYKLINDQYNSLQGYLKGKSDSISAMQKSIQDALDKTRTYNMEVEKQQEVERHNAITEQISSDNTSIAQAKNAFDQKVQMAQTLGYWVNSDGTKISTEAAVKDAQAALDAKRKNSLDKARLSLDQQKFNLDKQKEAFGESQTTNPLGIEGNPQSVKTLIDGGLANSLSDGSTYLDATQFSGKDRTSAENMARQAGIPILSSAAEVAAATKVDTEAKNLKNIMDMFSKIAPQDATSRIGDSMTNWAQEAADSPKGQLLRSYQDFIGTQVPALVQAVGGVNRVTSQEMSAYAHALPSVDPKSMDTWADAKLKIENLQRSLGNYQTSLLDNKKVFSDIHLYAQSLTPEQQKVAATKYDDMTKDGFTPDQILQIMQGKPPDQPAFNQPLGMGEKGSQVDLDKLASAIGQYESGGNYKSLGPVMPSGSYAGDRAYGKYQIMGKNIPSWTKEALGYSMSPKEFLNDIQAQDQVAKHFMNQHLNKYGTAEDVASMWLSGRPASGNAAKDLATGVSVPQYIRNVMKNYNQFT